MVNPYRPFNETREATLEMARKIEEKSGVSYTGMIANPHLLNETNDRIILEGVEKVKEITEFPLKYISVMQEYFSDRIRASLKDYGLNVLKKQMKRPWEQGGIKI